MYLLRYCFIERIYLHFKLLTAGKEGMCVWARSTSNPGLLGSEPSALTNCAGCPLDAALLFAVCYELSLTSNLCSHVLMQCFRRRARVPVHEVAVVF